MRKHLKGRFGAWALASVVLTPGLAWSAQAQLPGPRDSPTTPPEVERQRADPGNTYAELRLNRELILAGTGGGLLSAGFIMSTDVRGVPAGGFDPGEIAWTLDRDAVGDPRRWAGSASDMTRNAAILLPIVLGLAADREGGWSGLGRRAVVYAETMMISQGLTRVGKVAFGRPRPYAYLAEADRLQPPGYDAAHPGTFHAMPSGHSSSAWTAAAITTTEHLLLRPSASWIERVGVGFLGGALAGATSALRVAAGQHHPTDVVVGAAIGLATGITVPLLHRGEQPSPSLGEWAPSTVGLLMGATIGVLLSGT